MSHCEQMVLKKDKSMPEKKMFFLEQEKRSQEFQWRKYKWKGWMVQGQSFGCCASTIHLHAAFYCNIFKCDIPL
jgi:hypothetical protein